MIKFKIIWGFLCLFFYSGLHAQTKNEKESRVQLEVFPKSAKALIEQLPKSVKRIRYYKEIDGTKESYESKFKLKAYWHSIEFNTSGKLEDIEITIKKRQIPEPTFDAIKTYFTENSETFDLIKIQEQYVYTDTVSESDFLNSVIKNSVTTTSNYEIIVAIKTNKAWELKEVTFDSNGHFLSTRILEQDSYEYIMY